MTHAFDPVVDRILDAKTPAETLAALDAAGKAIFGRSWRTEAERTRERLRRWERDMRAVHNRTVRAQVSRGVFVTGTCRVARCIGGFEFVVVGPTGTEFRPCDGRVQLVLK